MTYHYSTNNSYISTEMGPYPLFDLKTLMIAHGWTITRSNNGTLFGATDYILTATDLTSQYSWMVLHHTASKREWLFGMNNDADYWEWYIGYSANVGGVAGFTGGDATTMPTATDEASLLGDRGIAPWDVFPVKNSRCHMMVDDASAAFYLLASVNETRCLCTCIAGDPLTKTHTLDTDPYVALAQFRTDAYGFPQSLWVSTSSYCGSRGWYNYPSGSAERIYGMSLVQNNVVVAPNDFKYGGGPNVYDGNDEAYPVFWGRSATLGAPSGIKGMSTLFRNVTTVRAACDILTVGTESQIMAGCRYSYNVSLPWDPTVIPH